MTFQSAVKFYLIQDFDFVKHFSVINMKGVPDLYILHRGKCIWIELKFTRDVDRKGVHFKHWYSFEQLEFLSKVNDSGGLGIGIIGFYCHRDKTLKYKLLNPPSLFTKDFNDYEFSDLSEVSEALQLLVSNFR